jgi:pyruvate/2-oxoglutarate dehydrogenase complex dihydrolipoamide acyltransferase (E2) component
MENAVYWKGHQVGIECAGRISWFASAPQEAIAAYGTTRTKPAVVGDSVVARNLVMTLSYDRRDFPV